MSNNEPAKQTRLIWLLLLAGIVILLFWAGMKSWRLYQASSSLLARQGQAEYLLADGLGGLEANAVEDLVYGMRRDVVNLNNEISFLTPIMPYFDWVPVVGPLAAAAPHLMEMADAGTESAAYAFRGMKPALTLLQEERDSSSIPQVLQIMESAKPDLARASLAMDRVVAARAEIDNLDALPWRVRSLLAKGDEWLPLGQAGLKLTLVLPEMMGLNQPRRYLIIAQNEDELRATGGFISGAGLVEVDRGRIAKLDFQDANSVDAWSANQVLTKPYGEAPLALSELMLLDLFLFRDANFWPDFTISAEKAMDLYSYGRGVAPLDGALAIDQRFIKLLVAGTGPVFVPDSGEVINEANAIGSLQDAWTLEEGVGNRKAFLSVFAQAIRNRLENELSGVDPVHLARQIDTALREKDLQLHVRDPLASGVLAEIGWDGRLPHPSNHDVLLAVDTNVGYNKANIFVEREMSYDVHLADDGSALANLTITHLHKGEDNGEACWQGTLQEYRDGAQYQELADKCYWNYLRVYVPENSLLIEGPQHVVPADTWFGGFTWDRPAEAISELPGFTTFTSFMLLPKAAQASSHFQYELPSTITQEFEKYQRYELRLYKQAGASEQKVEVALTLPAGSRLVSTQPQPSAQDGSTVYFTINLNSDQMITITYD